MENQQDDIRPWLRIVDEGLSSEALMLQVQQRVEQRRKESGVLQIAYPKYGYVSEYPEPPSDRRLASNPNLYYYLKQVNLGPGSRIEPILTPSPSTEVPVIGRIWKRVRAEFHNLILFYVNRSIGDQNLYQINVISTLNELTRVTQIQQAEIDALRDELRRALTSNH